MTPRAYLSVHPLPFGHTVAQSDGIDWMKAALRRANESGALPDVDRAVRFYDLLARKSAVETRVTAQYTRWARARAELRPRPPLQRCRCAES